MKKFLRISLCIIMAVCLCLGVAACSNAGSKEGFSGMKVRKNGDTYVLNSYSAVEGETALTVGKDGGDVTDKGERNITEIGASAFKNNSTLTEITVTSNVTEIGKGAFAGMTKLTKLVLPFAGAKVGAVNEQRLLGYLFGTDSYEGGVACTQKQDAGDTTVTYYLPATLSTVEINYTGEEAYTLPAYTFNGLTVLRNVTVTGNVTEIGEGAFAGTMMSEFKMPAETVKVGNSAFKNCARLTSVDFTASTKLDTLGEYAFAGTQCKAMSLPSSVKEVGAYCFASTDEYETKLETITMTGVKKVWEYAFKDCKYLMTFTASDVETVYVGAFMNCVRLTTVSGIDFTTAEADAFYGCEALEK